MPLWLTNSPRKARKRKKVGYVTGGGRVRRRKMNRGRKRRRKLAGAALAAHLKKIGTRAGTARHAAGRAASHGGGMAKRKRRRARANPKRRRRRHSTKLVQRRRSNPVRRIKHRRKHYRRNPGGSMVRSVIGIAKQGVKDAAGVVIGKAATRMVSGLIPFGANTGLMGAAKQVLVAVGVGYGAHRVMGKEFARMVVAGGIAAPLETLVKGLNIPLLSPALAAGDGAYAALGAYPRALPAGVGAYPLAGTDGYGDGSTGGDYAWDEM
jgi:hypothetical protein